MRKRFLSILFLSMMFVVGGCHNIDNPSSSNSVADHPFSEYNPITIAEALKLCTDEAGYVSETRSYVAGTIKNIENSVYGSMTIFDETGEIYVYGTYGADGEKRYSELEEKPVANDLVLLFANFANYNGTKEIKSGWIIDYKHVPVDIDENEYQPVTIAQAREAKQDAKLKVTGVVAQITYATGKVPSGFFLVDNSQSIYIYTPEAAAQVKVGNTVTVAGFKDYYVLETEISYANKFGYQGCCQLKFATILENDKKVSEFDKSWVEEKTVKEILNLPITENFTTTIFKTNALITKSPGNGFVNYYINDLDGKTGSYVYTQCNGNDLDYLQPYDGKIMTVYVSPINAKASASGCIYRFLPILLEDNHYQFDLANTPKFIVEYYGKDQFFKEYTGDPKLEVVTSVTSELLGFENATISYSSSDNNVIYFAEEDGKIIMHAKNSGTAIITIQGSYATYPTFKEEISITVANAVQIEAATVKEVLEAEYETEVTVKGIIAASLVNKTGFYLVDETGVIAVLTSSEAMTTLALGNEIVVKGVKTQYGQKDENFGTTCILDAEILANYYGKNEYSTASFDTSKTLEDLLALDPTKDQTTQVYVLKATPKFVEATYYSNAYIQVGETELRLYTSSGKQYNWLKEYEGKEVTMEVTLVNWNGKSLVGAVLAVIDENNNKVCNSLNFN